jgi:hypothetical protein
MVSPTMARALPDIGSARVSKALFHSEAPRVVATSLKARPVHPRLRTDEPIAHAGAGSVVWQTNVRLTNATTVPMAFTQTFFVVVEGSENGFPDQPVYQIQLWRVMVFHPFVDPDSNRVPQKEI